MSDESRYRVAAPLVLALLVAAAYAGCLRNEYVFDDLMFIRDDPRVRSLHEAPRLFVEALWGYADKEGRVHLHQYYRPLQTFPLALFYAWTGEQAWPAHLYSLALHWLNSWLAFAIFRRLSGSAPAALLAAAIFAVHPGYSEAVLWISDYAGLGADLCIMSIFLLHQSGNGARPLGWLATAVLTLLGLWHKESGVLAPVLVAFHDLLFGATNRRIRADSESQPSFGRLRAIARTIFRYSAFVPPILLYQHLRLRALGGMLPGFDSVPLTTFELVINGVGLIPDFVRTFFWPVPLNMYHDFDAIRSMTDATFLLGATTLAVGAVAFFGTLRTRPAVAFGLFWAMLTAAPHLMVRWPQLNVFAERYTYMPAVGLFLAFAAVVGNLSPTLRLRLLNIQDSTFSIIALSTLLVACIVRTNLRIPDWHDDVVLYGKAIRQSPRASLVRNNLAVKFLELGRWDEGIALLEELKRRDPDWRDVNKNLGLLYLGKGDDAKAAASFEAAQRADPTDRTTVLNLGYVYDKMGQRERAVAKYVELIQLDPSNTHGWYNLALIATEMGQFENARLALQKILAVDPGDRPALTLTRRLKKVTQPSVRVDATQTLRRCEAARRLGEEKGWGEASYSLQAAAWLDESSPVPHQYLANVAFMQGRLRLAVQHQRLALQRDPQNELYRRNLESLEATLKAKERG